MGAEKVGELIRAERKALNCTQEQFGEKFGVGPIAIMDLEKGRGGNVLLLDKVCRFVGISLLLGDGENVITLPPPPEDSKPTKVVKLERKATKEEKEVVDENELKSTLAGQASLAMGEAQKTLRFLAKGGDINNLDFTIELASGKIDFHITRGKE